MLSPATEHRRRSERTAANACKTSFVPHQIVASDVTAPVHLLNATRTSRNNLWNDHRIVLESESDPVHRILHQSWTHRQKLFSKGTGMALLISKVVRTIMTNCPILRVQQMCQHRMTLQSKTNHPSILETIVCHLRPPTQLTWTY